MKVKELREYLAECDDDAVVVAESTSGEDNVRTVRPYRTVILVSNALIRMWELGRYGWPRAADDGRTGTVKQAVIFY